MLVWSYVFGTCLLEVTIHIPGVPLHHSQQNITEHPWITDLLQIIRNPCRWITTHPTARPAKAGSILDIFPQSGLFLSGCPEISATPAGTQGRQCKDNP